jgi:hypothetical protein
MDLPQFYLAAIWHKLHARFESEKLEFVAFQVRLLFRTSNIYDWNHFGVKFKVRLTACVKIRLLDKVFGKWRDELETSVCSTVGIKG